MSTQCRNYSRIGLCILTIAACILISISAFAQDSLVMPANCVPITVIYAPESELYMTVAKDKFNQAYASGRDPITGELITNGECFWLVDLSRDDSGRQKSSGFVTGDILTALFRGEDVEGGETPVVFIPSVSHWLEIINTTYGSSVFDLSTPGKTPDTATSAMVIGIWESRLRALEAANPGQPIGWAELFNVIQSSWSQSMNQQTLPEGFDPARISVFTAHTSTVASSTGLSAMIMEFYASARYFAVNPYQISSPSDLTSDMVNDPTVIDSVRAYHRSVVLYSERTTELRLLIAGGDPNDTNARPILGEDGPAAVDFSPLEENDLVRINCERNADNGTWQERQYPWSPERMVALYPVDGVFVHNHPFGILNASWVDSGEREGAEKLREFVITDVDVQRAVLDSGLRPVVDSIPLDDSASPYAPINGGYSMCGLRLNYGTGLTAPSGDVMRAIQDAIPVQVIRRPAAAMILFDTSGSMQDNNRIFDAQLSAQQVIEALPSDTSIGFATFADDAVLISPLAPLVDVHKERVREDIQQTFALGQTALFDAIQLGREQVCASDPSYIPALVILSDGADVGSQVTEEEALEFVSQRCPDGRRIAVVVIAYETTVGSDARRVLNTIAASSGTEVYLASQVDIATIIERVIAKFRG